jgi:hypothetical protein
MTTPCDQESTDNVKLVMSVNQFNREEWWYVLNAIASGATLKNVMEMINSNPLIKRFHVQEEPDGLY